MGLIFNGNGDVIKAVDGSLTVEGLDLGGSSNVNAGIGTFSNLNVTGVLTYEDVKNVDSVGIITARDHLNIVTDGKKLQIGAGQDLTLYHSGTHSYIDNAIGNLVIQNDSSSTSEEILIQPKSGEQGIKLVANGQCEIYHDNSLRFYTTSSSVNVNSVDFIIPDSIVHDGDTNTKIRFPANDTITAETNGNERLRITSNGRVGILTISPERTLDVRGNFQIASTTGIGSTSFLVTDTSFKYNQIPGNSWGNCTHSPQPLIAWDWVSGTGDVLYLASGGNTATADQMAVVISDGHGVKIGKSGFNYTSHDTGTGANEFVRIKTDGTIGIGTASPIGQFHLHKASTSVTQVIECSSGAASLQIRHTNGYGTANFWYRGTEKYRVGQTNTSTDFNIYDVPNSAERFNIASNAVITATQPNSAIGLIVKNTAHDSQLQILATAANKNSVIWFGDAADGNIGWIDYDHNDNSMSFRVNAATRAWFDNTNALYLQGANHTNFEVRSNSASTKGIIQTVQDSDVRMGATTNHPLALYAGTTERMRIDTSGRLLVGTASNTDSNERLNITHPSDYVNNVITFSTQPANTIGNANILNFRDKGGISAQIIARNSAYGSGLDNALQFYTSTSSNNAPTVRMTIDETGRITAGKHGVGTSNDASEWFKVQSDDSAANISIVGSNDTHSTLNLGDEDDFNIQKIKSDHTDNSLQFFTADVQRVRIDSSGVVHLKSNTSAQNTTKELRFSPTTSTTRYGSIQAVNNSGNNHIDLRFFTADADTPAERVRITNGGDVSIGQVDSGSGATLHLRSATSAHTKIELSTKGNYNGSYQDAYISFVQQNGTELALIHCDTNTGAANRADLAFYTNFGGVYERMRITEGGIIRIGAQIHNTADLDSTNTKLIIKQSANSREDGLYIERSGERKGYYMWMQPGGGSGDSLTFSRNNNGTKSDVMYLDRDSNINLGTPSQTDSKNIYIGGKTAYPLCRTHSNRGMEIDYNRWRSPENHSSGISSWVLLGNDYGPNPYPVRTFKIAVPESGVEGTRVYQVWHDGDANYDYGGMWEIRINQWTSNARFESVAIRCVNGKRNDMCVRVFNNSNGIMIRPGTIWGRVYIRLAGYDSGQGYRGSSYCAVANNAALAIYNSQGTDDGTVPTSGSPVDLFAFDGHGGSYTGGRDIENSNWFAG